MVLTPVLITKEIEKNTGNGGSYTATISSSVVCGELTFEEIQEL